MKLLGGLAVAVLAPMALVVPSAPATPGTLPAASERAASETAASERAASERAAPGWPPTTPARLVINTGGTRIGRADYVDATMKLDGTRRATEIRGRGNSTWGWPKKPYKLKLAEDAALVGRRAHDEWVLLAGYADRSALRTPTAFTIARLTRLAWTPRFRFVNVVLNGRPQGLYLLTEQVEQGRGRVELPEGGHLLEINYRYLRDDEPGFHSGRGIPVAFKDPDEVTRTQRRAVRRAIRTFEDVLYSPRFTHPTQGYAAYIDVQSVIDWYLVEELFENTDSNFQSSVHFTWRPGRKLRFGPVWDFDLSAGTRWRGQTGPDGWLTRLGGHWISRMLEDPAFAARVKSRWTRLRPQVEAVIRQIPAAAAPLANAAAADWRRWHVSGDIPWTRHASDHAGEVAHLQNWLSARADWISRN